MNVLNFPERKQNHERVVMVTCYDYTMACLVADSDIDLILVGDSAAMVIQTQIFPTKRCENIGKFHVMVIFFFSAK